MIEGRLLKPFLRCILVTGSVRGSFGTGLVENSVLIDVVELCRSFCITTRLSKSRSENIKVIFE